MLGVWCKIWIYYSFFNHFCMAQPVVSKLLHVIDFKKWFPVGILRYRIYYGKIYIRQHSVYYSVPLHCSPTQWKMFTVVSNTVFQGEETQGHFLGQELELRGGVRLQDFWANASHPPCRPSKTRVSFTPTYPLDFIQKYFLLTVVCLSSG